MAISKILLISICIVANITPNGSTHRTDNVVRIDLYGNNTHCKVEFFDTELDNPGFHCCPLSDKCNPPYDPPYGYFFYQDKGCAFQYTVSYNVSQPTIITLDSPIKQLQKWTCEEGDWGGAAFQVPMNHRKAFN